MEIEKIKVETISYNNSKNIRDYNVISITDLELLNTWIDNSLIKFKGFQGKLLFLKDTTFPRYKFSDYSVNNNKVVRRVREAKSANALVLDLNYFKDLISKGLRNISYFQGIRVDSEGNNIHINISDYDENKPIPFIKKCYHINSYNIKIITNLGYLLHIYNNFNSLKIINVFDLSEEVNKGNDIIDVEFAKSINQLLGADDASVKLGMEMLTNCNFEASLLHIMILIANNNRKIRNNDYYSSVNFKNFRNKLYNYTNIHFDYLKTNTNDTVQEFLKIEGKSLLETDVDYIKDCIREELEQSITFIHNGYTISNFDITLNIDPSKIIANKVINTVVEQEESEVVKEVIEEQVESVIDDLNVY